MTIIGDSVAAGLSYEPAAARALGEGFDLKLDLKVCRRLVSPSCPYQGSAPTTGLEAVKAEGSGLGHTVVIDVGYNEDGTRYAQDMDLVLRTLRENGVRTVVWVTLRQTLGDYYRINAAIRREAARWPGLVRVTERGQPGQGLVRLGRRPPDRPGRDRPGPVPAPALVAAVRASSGAPGTL